ncbi:hypothetical protein BCV71DRAFT_272692 [Rhizopus microsporus]|uniref:Uncharacterized protein n=1 Tax=Rhizopus microsporus TaxID=58291 RepID=A0A1X0RVH5_RHIZD|nr:hypothetical protein BCV71DRAFT_272692 [Rhizopus microsporus]
MSNFGMRSSPNGTYVEDDGEEYRLVNRAIITEDIADKLGYSLYKALDGNNATRICMSYPDGSSTVVLPISDVIIEYHKEAGLGLPFLGEIATPITYLEDHITVGMPKNVVSWLSINLLRLIPDDLAYLSEECQRYVWFNVELSQETKAVVWGDLEKKAIDCGSMIDFLQKVQQNVIGIGMFEVSKYRGRVTFVLKKFQGVDITKKSPIRDLWRWETNFTTLCSDIISVKAG